MSDIPIKGWPKLAVPYLIDLLPSIIEHKNVVQFYLGRSNDLTQTKSRHGAEDIFALYETDSLFNAQEVEQSLIDEFGYHRKCNNENLHSGGGTSEEFVNYVYIALWYKN